MWQGQLLALYLRCRQTRTGMTFAHPGHLRQSFLTHELPANETMADIRLRSLAEDGGGMAAEDADVVEHGRHLEEGLVESQLGMASGNGQRTVGHLPTMGEQDVPQLGRGGVVFVDELNVIH